MKTLDIRIIFFSLLLLSLLPRPADAQFIYFQMEVESELSTDVVQNLEFGNVFVNSGVNRIEPGSPEMGIFEIRGLSRQQVFVTLNPPDSLMNANEDVETNIPVDIEASYNNGGGINDVDLAQPFLAGNSTRFSLGENSNPSEAPRWESAFIYIYGTLTVGEVSPGVYEGTIVFTVEYQ